MKCPQCNSPIKIHKLTPNQRIKYWRIEKGLNQSEMAKELGKTRTWLTNLEFRDGPMSQKNAIIFADYFNVSLDLLLRGKMIE